MRARGYAAIVVVPALILYVSWRIADSAYGGFDYLRFVVGAFPATVGLVASVIALEIGLARGRGRDAITASAGLGGVFALVNLLLMLGVLHGLGVV